MKGSTASSIDFEILDSSVSSYLSVWNTLSMDSQESSRDDRSEERSSHTWGGKTFTENVALLQNKDVSQQ